MFHWFQHGRKVIATAGTVIVCAIAMTGCSKGGTGNTSVATPQGTVDLQALKVGMPESTFQNAVITFVPDPKGSFDGKNQYISRATDANGGQYVAQCKNGQCFELQVYFNANPVSRDTALKTLQGLLPPETGAETSVNDAEVKAAKVDHPTEEHLYGKDYKGQVCYADKNSTGVILVNAWYMPPHVASGKADK